MASLKATFFAFKRRERGGVLAGIAAVHAVLVLALMLIFVALNFDVLVQVARGEESEPSLSITQAALLLLSTVLAPLTYCVVMGSYEAACLKWLIRGETSGFRGFSLGVDTWRVYGGQWIWFVIFVVLSSVALTVVAVFGDRSGLGPQTAWVLGALAVWGAIVSPLALRFAPGNAASVAKRKFSYFEAWRVSQGRTFALLGSFAVVWLLWAVIFMVIWLGAWIVIFLALGGDESGLSSTTVNLALSGCLGAGLLVANMSGALLSAGVNARAVLAAAENGNLEGVLTDVATVFE